LLLASLLFAGRAEGESWVDLSHPLGADTLYWPTGSPFELEVLAQGRDPEGRWYAANRFRTPEHLGTHIDAPFHFHPAGWKTDEIPLERMRGPALVVDARDLARGDPNVAIPASALREFETRRGEEIPRGAVVLIRTGWDAYWSDRARYFGTERPADASDLHFPGLAGDAARLLVARGVHAVGIDTASIDPGRSRLFEAHRILAAANVLIYENLSGLAGLPESGAEFFAFALPIRTGTGGPVRALARLE
jgi:kynurenine formamidase